MMRFHVTDSIGQHLLLENNLALNTNQTTDLFFKVIITPVPSKPSAHLHPLLVWVFLLEVKILPVILKD